MKELEDTGNALNKATVELEESLQAKTFCILTLFFDTEINIEPKSSADMSLLFATPP